MVKTSVCLSMGKVWSRMCRSIIFCRGKNDILIHDPLLLGFRELLRNILETLLQLLIKTYNFKQPPLPPSLKSLPFPPLLGKKPQGAYKQSFCGCPMRFQLTGGPEYILFYLQAESSHMKEISSLLCSQQNWIDFSLLSCYFRQTKKFYIWHVHAMHIANVYKHTYSRVRQNNGKHDKLLYIASMLYRQTISAWME